jgi:hypothetical protein
MSILDKDSMTEDHWSNNPRFKMEVIKTTNEHGVTNYETKQLGIPEYCALMDYPQKGKENLNVCLDGNFDLEDLKRLVAYMELIEKERT